MPSLTLTSLHYCLLVLHCFRAYLFAFIYIVLHGSKFQPKHMFIFLHIVTTSNYFVKKVSPSLFFLPWNMISCKKIKSRPFDSSHKTSSSKNSICFWTQEHGKDIFAVLVATVHRKIVDLVTTKLVRYGFTGLSLGFINCGSDLLLPLLLLALFIQDWQTDPC